MRTSDGCADGEAHVVSSVREYPHFQWHSRIVTSGNLIVFTASPRPLLASMGHGHGLLNGAISNSTDKCDH